MEALTSIAGLVEGGVTVVSVAVMGWLLWYVLTDHRKERDEYREERKEMREEFKEESQRAKQQHDKAVAVLDKYTDIIRSIND